MQSSTEANKAIVMRYYQLFSVPTDEEAMSIAEEIFADDFFFDDPPLGREVKGVEGAKEWVAAERRVFSKRKEVVETILAENEFVATSHTVSGAYCGENFYDMESEDRHERMMSTRVLNIYKIRDGKIVHLCMRYDSHDLLQQMGVLNESS